MSTPPPFTCAICQRFYENRFPGPRRDWPIPPVCRSCEGYWGGKVAHSGAFKDRRKAVQINALSEAIASAAHSQYYRDNGYATKGL